MQSPTFSDTELAKAFQSHEDSWALRGSCIFAHCSLILSLTLCYSIKLNQSRTKRHTFNSMKSSHPIILLLSALVPSGHGQESSLTAGFAGTNKGVSGQSLSITLHLLLVPSSSFHSLLLLQYDSQWKYIYNKGQDSADINQTIRYQPGRATQSDSSST